jgi:hypothetical protein
MKFLRHRAQPSRAGMTALEMSIALGMLMLVASTVTQSMATMQRIQRASDAASDAQAHAAKAMQRLITDLKASGFAVVGGLAYPHLFEGGSVGGGYPDEHDHEPAQKTAAAGEDAAGPDREILFLRWRDQNQDGVPDVDMASSTLLWDTGGPVSYTLVTLPNGENVLQRRVTGEPPHVVARHVERFACQVPGDPGVELPVNSVRVRLWLRVPIGDGDFVEENTQATIRLRNGANQ